MALATHLRGSPQPSEDSERSLSASNRAQTSVETPVETKGVERQNQNQDREATAQPLRN
jgi:hypothetical protein